MCAKIGSDFLSGSTLSISKVTLITVFCAHRLSFGFNLFVLNEAVTRAKTADECCAILYQSQHFGQFIVMSHPWVPMQYFSIIFTGGRSGEQQTGHDEDHPGSQPCSRHYHRGDHNLVTTSRKTLNTFCTV